MNKPATELNPKRIRFVQEYPIDFNATQAAIRAGYSKKTAGSQGDRLLKNVNIQAAINASLEKTAVKSEISVQWVLNGLKIIAVQGVEEKDYSGANRAFELIGKHLGMFIDRIQDVTQALPVRVIIQVDDDSDSRRNHDNG